MFCPFCGTDNAEGIKFCGECGKLIPEELAIKIDTPAPPAKIQKKSTYVVKKSKSDNNTTILTKENGISALFFLIRAALYAGISAIMILLINMKDTVVIKAVSEKNDDLLFTMKDMMNLFTEGNRLFYPTTLTTTATLCINIFIYCIPVFAFICLFGAAASKNSKPFNTLFTVISVFSSVIATAIIPVTIAVVPDFNTALALYANVLVDDIGTVTVTKILLFTILSIVLTIAASVITSIEIKRRNK